MKGTSGARSSGGRASPPPSAPERGRAAPAGVLVVNGYSERWLRQGFPWVYPNEVAGGSAPLGAVVQLRSVAGEPLGTAIADDGWIRARRFRADAGPIDGALIHARLASALTLRRALGLVGPDACYRLANGENDDLPGVRVDVWGASAVVSLDSPSLLALVPALVAATVALTGVGAVHVGWRPDSRDARVWPPPPGLVHGEDAGPAVVVDPPPGPGVRSLRYRVDVGAKKDVGLFPDQRDNRSWLASHYRGAADSGVRVLNLFCYTGAFSVHALAHGAREVVSVDLSRPYLDRLDENLALNALPAPGQTHERIEDDAIKVLDRFRRQGRVFDRIILDPPGHSHSGGTDWSGEQDYARLVAAAARVCAPGGWIIASSNLGSVSPRQFHGALIDGLRKAECQGRVIHTGGQAPDFPAALHFPEGSFLKFVVLEVAHAPPRATATPVPAGPVKPGRKP